MFTLRRQEKHKDNCDDIDKILCPARLETFIQTALLQVINISKH